MTKQIKQIISIDQKIEELIDSLNVVWRGLDNRLQILEQNKKEFDEAIEKEIEEITIPSINVYNNIYRNGIEEPEVLEDTPEETTNEDTNIISVNNNFKIMNDRINILEANNNILLDYVHKHYIQTN